MAKTHSSIATDSEADLRSVIGSDSTATFEDDPKFIDSDPTSTASSENIPVQRDTDDLEDSDEEKDEEDELDEEDEDDELDDEDDLEDDDEDDEEEEDDAEEIAALQAKTFEDDGEIDEDPGVDEDGAEIDEEGDDLDTDRVGDAAIGLSPWRIAPTPGARVSIGI